MNISGLVAQNLTVTLSGSSVVRLEGLRQQPRNGTPGSATTVNATPVPVDTVTLSPQAIRAHETSLSQAAPARGDALFDALDADRDGAVTREEFVDGARTLLRRGHARHADRHDEAVRADRGHHHAHGLSKRLDRLFDHVDGTEDGTIDKAELASALARASGSAAVPPPAAPDAPAPATVSPTIVQVTPAEGGTSGPEPTGAPAGGSFVSVAQVTVVTLAIQQYTTVSLGDLVELPRTISTSA